MQTATMAWCQMLGRLALDSMSLGDRIATCLAVSRPLRVQRSQRGDYVWVREANAAACKDLPCRHEIGD